MAKIRCFVALFLSAMLISVPAGEQFASGNVLPVYTNLPVEKKIDYRQFTGQIEQSEKFYADSDAIALAKMTWGEAGAVKDQTLPDGRVISSTAQKAAVMWTALNQYDAGIADSLLGVITKPNNFYGYDPAHPVQEDLLALAYDVLDRWEREKLGETDVGRVLPPDYIYFTGDGKYNYFCDEFHTNTYYDWRLEDIYAENQIEAYRLKPPCSGRLAALPVRDAGRADLYQNPTAL